MRFFKFLIAALVMVGGVLISGCGSGPTSPEPEAESVFFDRLELPSYEYVNGEVALDRIVVMARGEKTGIEAFVWEFFLQDLSLEKFKLLAYKDANFTISAYKANPIAVYDRKIPDNRPDYYNGQYPFYEIPLSVDLGNAKYIDLSVDTPIYFELRGLMTVLSKRPGLYRDLSNVRFYNQPAAKKPTIKNILSLREDPYTKTAE